ncbi:expressed unknown protein [Seminavis robusta]|uniref:MYND-type domain-containing protein n=1 Tax=Seminavis robusta TaxID=568900 RepID=A0A9N8EN13_9STRA|nr:expressed unknown protein [Seminavis robusta]|eukprot:Sro1444_g273270.1 n/a (340) ;mRNA; r:18564-19583
MMGLVLSVLTMPLWQFLCGLVILPTVVAFVILVLCFKDGGETFRSNLSLRDQEQPEEWKTSLLFTLFVYCKFPLLIMANAGMALHEHLDGVVRNVVDDLVFDDARPYNDEDDDTTVLQGDDNEASLQDDASSLEVNEAESEQEHDEEEASAEEEVDLHGDWEFYISIAAIDQAQWERLIQELLQETTIQDALQLLETDGKHDYQQVKALWKRKTPSTTLADTDGNEADLRALAESYISTAFHWLFLVGGDNGKPSKWQLQKAMKQGADWKENFSRFWGPFPEYIFAIEACANCGKHESEDETQLLSCAACMMALYCGATCQKEHWKSTHKIECRKNRRE